MHLKQQMNKCKKLAVANTNIN